MAEKGEVWFPTAELWHWVNRRLMSLGQGTTQTRPAPRELILSFTGVHTVLGILLGAGDI
jgi:hypothetical protein